MEILGQFSAEIDTPSSGVLAWFHASAITGLP
jgi:hypothetical protein